MQQEINSVLRIEVHNRIPDRQTRRRKIFGTWLQVRGGTGQKGVPNLKHFCELGINCCSRGKAGLSGCCTRAVQLWFDSRKCSGCRRGLFVCKGRRPFFPRWVNVSSMEARRAEVELLKGCSTKLKLVDTPIGEGKEEVIHSITGGSESAPNLVCMPGYGAGAAFYFRNLDAFCAKFRTHAVDWLGTGNSGRPRFKAKTREEAENFFLKSLETWREKTGLEKFVLMGHSLGGYLAANYALQHPERVDHLILVCPAAVSKQPENSEMPDWAKSPWTFRGQLWRSLTCLWNNGVTPQMAIRSLGPAGRRLVDGYVTKRFTQGTELTPEESTAMGNYFYQITASTGSGEFALRHVMAPFAWGRAPLEERLSGLKVPVTFIYGEQDWMDPKGAQTVCDSITREQGPPKNSSDRTIRIIPESGHFVFIDQPDHFHKEVYKACEPHLGGK